MEILQGLTNFCVLGPTCHPDWEAWSAVFTAAVGLLAWATSRKATAISDQAVRIARQQHAEQVAVREASARVIGRVLLAEVTGLPAHLHSIRADLATAYDAGSRTLRDIGVLGRAVADARKPHVSGIEAAEIRLHVMPDRIGDDLCTLIGGDRTLRLIADKVGDLLEPIRGDMNMGIQTPGLAALALRLDTLQGHLTWFIQVSAALANEFQAFVGVEQTDYRDLDPGVVAPFRAQLRAPTHGPDPGA